VSGLRIDPRNAIGKLNAEKDRRAYAIEVLGRTAAAQMQDEAKHTHPWQNRSGEAEKRIVGRAERRGDVTRISLSGGVRYMVYLELAMGKRWAVLWPTIKRNTPKILQAIAKLGGGR